MVYQRKKGESESQQVIKSSAYSCLIASPISLSGILSVAVVVCVSVNFLLYMLVHGCVFAPPLSAYLYVQAQMDLETPHSLRSRALTWRPPIPDGVNQQPFWAQLSSELPGTRPQRASPATESAQTHVETSVRKQMNPSAVSEIITPVLFPQGQAGRLGSGMGWERLHSWPASLEGVRVGGPSKKRGDPLCQETQPSHLQGRSGSREKKKPLIAVNLQWWWLH